MRCSDHICFSGSETVSGIQDNFLGVSADLDAQFGAVSDRFIEAEYKYFQQESEVKSCKLGIGC